MSQREVNAITGRLSLRAPQHDALKQLASAIAASTAAKSHDRDAADVGGQCVDGGTGYV